MTSWQTIRFSEWAVIQVSYLISYLKKTVEIFLWNKWNEKLHTPVLQIYGTHAHAHTEYHSSAKTKIFTANCPEYDKKYVQI